MGELLGFLVALFAGGAFAAWALTAWLIRGNDRDVDSYSAEIDR
jgi:hypothetical protein